MRTITVAMDGSVGAGGAAAWAAALASTVGAELILLTAAPAGGQVAPPIPPGVPHGASVRRMTVCGDPRHALAEAAGALGSDLLVVGSSGLGWFPAVHADHVAHHLVCHVRLPVAVVPREAPAVPFARVVLGVDGSPGSAAASRWVAGLPPELTTDVVAVHAVAAPLPELVTFSRSPAAETDADVREWIAPLERRGLPVSVINIPEDPVASICFPADARRGSVIVLGGRPRDPHRPVRLGSVGLRVLGEGRHPVVVVPPAR